MIEEKMTQEQIRLAGLEALERELGVVGMVRFMQQFENGRGNYTEERHKWLDQLTVDDVISQIQDRRQQKDQI